jgi:hypothetical protein
MIRDPFTRVRHGSRLCVRVEFSIAIRFGVNYQADAFLLVHYSREFSPTALLSAVQVVLVHFCAF